MKKKEFLDILRQSLEGEVDNSIAEQSIRFYSEYISSHADKSEEEVIGEIGDPRLIAKTIIESEKMSNRKDTSSRTNYDSNRNREHYGDYSKDDYNGASNNKDGFGRIKWYHRLAIISIIILFFLLLVRIGWIFIRLSSIFLVPIIIIAFLLLMFKNQ